MGCECNSCVNAYTLPQGPQGLIGANGPRGPQGPPGASAGINDGIIHSSFNVENSGIGSATHVFSKLNYAMPVGLLDGNGDTLFIKASFHRDDPSVHPVVGTPYMQGEEDFSIHIGTQKITNEFSGSFPVGTPRRPWTADVEIYLTRINNTTFTSVCHITKLTRFDPTIGTGPIDTSVYTTYRNRSFYLRYNSSVAMDFDNNPYDINASTVYSGITTPVTMLHMTIQKISKSI